MSSAYLDSVLQRLLPQGASADLLMATLTDGDVAKRAWDHWRRRFKSPLTQVLATDRIVSRPLLPLLHESVRRSSLEIDAETLTYLRCACLREALRTKVYHRALNELANRLQSAQIPFLILKGAALGRQYYDGDSLRHTHDLEVLVHEPIEQAQRALVGSHFAQVGRQWLHESGLPLQIHTEVFTPAFDFDQRILWSTSIPLDGEDSDGAPRTLDPVHALVHVLVHASRSPARRTHRWACDAHFIVRAKTVDWRQFTQKVSELGAALPVVTQLRWLREHLGTAVPEEVLSELGARAARCDRAELRSCVSGLYNGRLRRWSIAWTLARI